MTFPMNCLQACTEAKCLIAPNNCEESQLLYLGNAPLAGEVYIVSLTDLNTDRTIDISVTSGDSNELVIDFSENNPLWFNPETRYSLYVTRNGEQVPLDIDGEEYECLILTFFRKFDVDNVQVPATEQIITI